MHLLCERRVFAGVFVASKEQHAYPVPDNRGRGYDVERHGQCGALLDELHVETRARELPLDVRVLLDGLERRGEHGDEHANQNGDVDHVKESEHDQAEYGRELILKRLEQRIVVGAQRIDGEYHGLERQADAFRRFMFLLLLLLLLSSSRSAKWN